MFTTKVGELFIPGKTCYQESVWFEYSESGLYLIFAFNKPSKGEIEAAKTGRVDLALYESDLVLFILHRIHGLEEWSDAPFSIRMYENKTFDWSEPIEDGQGLALHVVLVDASTGVLLAQRVVGTSTEFARELRAAILRQTECPFSISSYNMRINEVYSRHSSSQLVKMSKAKHRVGGK